ncbi:hypothetical protein SAMD00019534_092880 [Acytostelium subglobosum LB1]|uniref:hypothetical protein n=1 Tax=Acytostelium subglobosum LB1 TaxID=1410327 RepID=UPI0006449854|nr:hypothetical protein SAMD00019534_092880 [Acytostelium subglobosum LB1]GAM26113.1 hypothetical protein SAMD00019534_092880 [Acytostelium subglobosum LB1]|eukprot:XP_012751156.1 hypothetical protein SAMD00019534_092880 [Acytostelium subglobosum LB1]
MVELTVNYGTMNNQFVQISETAQTQPAVDIGAFPSTLTKLTLSHVYQPLIPNTLPSSIVMLSFGDNFNDVISAGCLPNRLTSLTFGQFYNQPLVVDALPSTLVYLEFGSWFNRSLEAFVETSYPLNVVRHNLPCLETLILGQSFSQDIFPGLLPPSLLTFKTGWSFSQELVPGFVPPNLHTLALGASYRHDIGALLPSSVTSLQYMGSYNLSQLSLSHLTVELLRQFERLKCNVETLRVTEVNFNQAPPRYFRHLKSLTIKSSTPKHMVRLKSRLVEYLKNLLSSMPSVDRYNVTYTKGEGYGSNKTDYNVELRKLDPWKSVIIYKVSERKYRTPPTSTMSIHFFAMDRAGQLENENSMLKEEIGSLKQLAEAKSVIQEMGTIPTMKIEVADETEADGNTNETTTRKEQVTSCQQGQPGAREERNKGGVREWFIAKMGLLVQ